MRYVMTNRISILRYERNLTQKQLANDLSMHYNTLSRYERGQVEMPVSEAVRIADYFDVSLDYLCMRSDHKQHYTAIMA